MRQTPPHKHSSSQSGGWVGKREPVAQGDARLTAVAVKRGVVWSFRDGPAGCRFMASAVAMMAAAGGPVLNGADAAGLKEAAGMYEQLRAEWNRKNLSLSKCGDLLGRLKLALLELNFLPTTGTKLTKQQLILARDILEIGAQWSILKKDIPSFERYMAQLKCYYFDYKDELPESAYKHQLLGLNLLFLLSQNRVAEFHTELERLPAKDIQTNVYIKHPVSLEQYLMEGSYNKVFLAKGNIPAESYAFFIDILLDTVRDEIASCIEKAYEKILLNEATRMLFFTPKKMSDYAKKRGWLLGSNNHYCFTGQQQKPEDATIPSTELAKQVIEYARQLEMIV
ncbi:26S proteasome non-ATPase regulatory subunit 8 [Pituophis catenifer annectens]|uniref:26S proteasome non-ATPase regulatory subunit 8 n=1 Tax=Pituophis catenifer annectens TaxID=94852 RepID=UPI003996317B